MGNPYLSSGESILRITDRISVNSVLSDLLLTTHRLILVDSTRSRFEPMQIPFAIIISLRGGWNIAGDPVITLTLVGQGSSDYTHSLDLIFSQREGEHRKDECDGWVEYLMDQIVLARQKMIRTDTALVDQETGIQPLVRRWVAPEMIPPHTTIAFPRPVPSGDGTNPIKLDSPRGTEHEAESTALPVQSEKEVKEEPKVLKEEVRSPNSLIHPARAIEEFVDAREGERGLSDQAHSATSDITDIPVNPEEITKSCGERISCIIKSQEPSGIPKEEDTHPVMSEEDKELPETILLPEPEVCQSSEIPEIVPGSPKSPTPLEQELTEETAFHEERQDLRAPEIFHPPESMKSGIILTHEIELPDDVLPDEPKTHNTPPLPEAEHPVQSALPSHIPESIGWPVIPTNEPASPKTNIPRRSDVFGYEEIPVSPPPMQISGFGRHTIFIAIAICIVILAIAGGAIFYSQYLAGDYGKAHIPEIIPTPKISQPPTIPEVIVPKTGIWVQVVCNSTFLGLVGNPGSLKMVSGSGNQLYLIQQSTGAVQASFQKQEYNGDLMTIEIYNNGKRIVHREITAPKGSIDFIIDPKTGEPFGLLLNRT